MTKNKASRTRPAALLSNGLHSHSPSHPFAAKASASAPGTTGTLRTMLAEMLGRGEITSATWRHLHAEAWRVEMVGK